VNLLDLKLLFLDLQTTGASPATGAPLEIAWALGRGKDARSKITTRYLLRQPDDQPVPRRIQALTGITDGDMEHAVDWQHAKSQMLDSLAESARKAFVIHYAQFERPFLRELFEQFDDEYEVVCTHQIATRIFPNLPSRGIRGLSGYFGFPLDECKRADTHVTATFAIWKHLCGLLEEREVRTWEELRTWLKEAPKAKRTHYEYPLERGIRLSMPDCPGIYKMISRRGDVLYVGKATSLKDRVNSYFRGRKHRDPKKLEMLTQAWDIKVETCPTVLEACLREVQEIKKLSPPYNIALNTGIRPLLYYSHDFSSSALKQTDQHPVGPFRNEFVLDAFTRLLHSLRSGKWDTLLFYEEIDSQLMAQGFELFLKNQNLSREVFHNARSALALGVWLCRKRRVEIEAEEESIDAQANEVEDEEVELTPEDIAAKFERLLISAASSYLLSRKLTKLFNTQITFTESGVERTIAVSDLGVEGWSQADIETFDLLRVLHTELNRLRKNGEQVVIIPHFHARNREQICPLYVPVREKL
jgi:DNA polymerase III subunit epsilon